MRSRELQEAIDLTLSLIQETNASYDFYYRKIQEWQIELALLQLEVESE